MGHITSPPPTPPQGRGAVRLSHKAYKSYKSHKPYKTYKPSPLLGGLWGATNMSHITDQYESYYFGEACWQCLKMARYAIKEGLLAFKEKYIYKLFSKNDRLHQG